MMSRFKYTHYLFGYCEGFTETDMKVKIAVGKDAWQYVKFTDKAASTHR